MSSDAKNSHFARLRRQFRDQQTRIKNHNHKKICHDSQLKDNEIWLYGLHTVEYALKNPNRKIIELLLTKNAENKIKEKIDLNNIDYKNISINEINKYVGEQAVHQGVLMKTLPLKPMELNKCKNNDLILLLDQITDPHNVGAIIRSAVALKVDSIITTHKHSAHESAVLAKSASGALELINYVTVKNLSQAILELKEAGFFIIGLDSEGEQSIEEIIEGNKIALVLGSEGKGLRHKTKLNVSKLAKLEMPGEIKSLNVSNAAALSIYITRNYLNRKLT
ncbi:23S rRNA (guanosine(2251)-2'-O)-methyltransferase RlmB [Bartonella sp. DGB1]|uniref:23S rRNA (guanosine(2251)-2'-O)-methyltransferase RlmB n=1 Tax=Bartonella sp. DGB1 TaxID=3239807 RepID=UPI0035245CF2